MPELKGSKLGTGNSINGKLFKISIVYFALFLAQSLWRTTLNNNAVNNFDLNESQIGFVFAAIYVPGIFAFTIGLVARHLALYVLLVFACLSPATGMFVISFADQLSALVTATLLIAFGFTFFYTVANSACLLGSDKAHAPYELGRLKSLGPLAGFFAALILIILFAPASLSKWFSILDSSDFLDSLGQLITFSHHSPEFDGRLLRSLLATIAGLLLLLGLYVGVTIRLSHVGKSHGRFNIRRGLTPYYALNFLAGCRSAIFQTFALFIMIKQYQLPVSGTAVLVMTSHLFSFMGYRCIGLTLRRFQHRHVLTIIYAVVATNFVGFWWLNSGAFGSTQLIVLGLGALFIIDSFFFGASVVTDSHLKLTSDSNDFIGDIGAGMTMFSIAALLMSMLGSLLWEPLGNNAFLLGTLVCLSAMVISQLTLNPHKEGEPATNKSSA
jgi:hypothetical protein